MIASCWYYTYFQVFKDLKKDIKRPSQDIAAKYNAESYVSDVKNKVFEEFGTENICKLEGDSLAKLKVLFDYLVSDVKTKSKVFEEYGITEHKSHAQWHRLLNMCPI